jgi:signal recognition particle subunit SRP68
MKSSQPDDTSEQRLPGSTRAHIFSRLIKASKEAELLVDLLKDQATSKASDTDILEAHAYTSYLLGSAHFEKHSTSLRLSDVDAQREKWQDCMENLSTARVIYAALLKKTKKEQFKDILAREIDQSLRVAAYQTSIPRTVPVSEVARKYFPKDEERVVRAVEAADPDAFKSQEGLDGGAGGLPNAIEWRGRKANLVDAAIGQALVTVSEAESTLVSFLDENQNANAKDRAAAYDPALIASQDAVDAVRHAIEEHEKEQIPESDTRMQDLRVSSLAINYDTIGWRVGRNRLLIGADDGLELDSLPIKAHRAARKDGKEVPERPVGRGRYIARLKERVVLYDAILQSIDSVKELRGAARDDDFVKELDGKASYFRALKYELCPLLA